MKIICITVVFILTLIALISIDIDDGIKSNKPDWYTLLLWKINKCRRKKKLHRYCRYYWRIIDTEAYGKYFSSFDELYKEINKKYNELFGKEEQLELLRYEKNTIKLSINSIKGLDLNGYVGNLLTVCAMVGSSIFGALLSNALSGDKDKPRINPNDVWSIMGETFLFLVAIAFLAYVISMKLSDESLKNFYIMSFDILENIERELENKNKRYMKMKQKTLYDLKLEIKNLNNSLNNIYNVNKEIAVTNSNEITEGIDLINKKVEDLKKFYSIK